MARNAVLVLSTVATLLVVAGFGMFCLDEWGKGSDQQVARLAAANGPSPDPDRERMREEGAGPLREAINDANDVLLDPFAGLVANSGSTWVRNGVPALLGFLLYGLILRVLAGYLPAPSGPEPRGWATPR